MRRSAPWLAALTLAAFAPAGAAAAQSTADPHQGHAHASPGALAPVPPVTDGDRILGEANAPITLIEYASFTCGHCASWHEEVYPLIKARYIDTGQVRFIHRDLPTAPHDLARRAAVVARCAAPDRFYPAVDSLMGGQAALRESRDPVAWLMNAAVAGELTGERLDACLDDPALEAQIDASIQGAVAAGVTSTPSFFINGQRVDGDLDSLEAAITPLIEQGG